jgi:arylsulfatase A-like enzyme
VVEEPVSVVSVMPTLLDLLGLPGHEALHGPSLAPVLRGAEPTPQTLFAEVDFLPVFDPNKRAAKKAVIHGGFKLIRDERSGVLELYDLDADPEERRDLASSRPERVRRMLRLLEERADAAGRGALPARAREPSLDELERLRALGYGGS